MTKSQNTKNEQQKDLCIKVEKQVWESTLNRSMKLQAENETLKDLLKECKDYLPEFETPMDILTKIDEVLKCGNIK